MTKRKSSKKGRAARPRAAARARERALAKLAEQRARLFLLEAGGTPERPLEVSTPVLVDLKAEGRRCPTCDVSLQVLEHRAPSSEGMRIREAVVRCPRCGQVRSVWFRLTSAEPS